MSTFAGEQLTDPLLARFSIERAAGYADRAIVICTVDEHGWPHPAMISTLEAVARDARNIRLAVHVGSRTARNLTANGRLTMVVADQELVAYIKGDVLRLAPSLTSVPDLAPFNMRVDSVLVDNPAAHEQARITSGIAVERRIDLERARTVLNELLTM